MKKLTKNQAELLEAMRNGVICHYMPYTGRLNPSSYYFRYDNHQRCTATAEALLSRGLVKIIDKDWRGHKLVYVPQDEPTTTTETKEPNEQKQV